MPPDAAPSPCASLSCAPAPGRRQVLGLVGGLGLLNGLAGCGIRLEDDAPDLPFVPVRTPLPAEAALLGLLSGTRDLAVLTRGWQAGGGTAERLATIHDDQGEVLAALLRANGVPADAVTSAWPPASPTAATDSASPGATSGPTTTGTGTPGPDGPPTRTSVATHEALALADASALTSADAAFRPTVAAILAQRAATVTVLGGTRPALAQAAEASWSPGAVAPLLAATRSARYGFEVVAAHSDAATLRSARAALAELSALDAEQLGALRQPGPDPAGYVLPFPVRTPTAAAKLGSRLATGMVAAYGSVLTPTNPAVAPTTMLSVVDWLARAQSLATRWHAPLLAFPGMTRPG